MRFPTPMPDRDQAVNSTVARTPCRGSAGRHASPSDTIKHTHLRGPEKLVRIFHFNFSIFFLHFPSDAISSYIHVRTSFSGPRRCVCSIVSWGLITAGTPTARCTRGGRIDSLITLRHWCWNTHGSNPIVSLEGMSQIGFLSAK